MKNLEIKVFSASWCGPCKIYAPIIDSMKEAGYNIKKFDIDDDFESATSYGVRSIPTTIICDGDTEISRFSGTKTENQLLEFINKI